jgi:hypothetical protein
VDGGLSCVAVKRTRRTLLRGASTLTPCRAVGLRAIRKIAWNYKSNLLAAAQRWVAPSFVRLRPDAPACFVVRDHTGRARLYLLRE